MSKADAVAFLERVETDEQFASELESAKEDQQAVRAKVQAAGFDATPDEIVEAITDRYGVELTPEQLDAVAAGSDVEPGAIVGGIFAGALAAAIAAAG
jgi:predicted ribosomally synthesized peptide with nif11-like leader